ncbi:MAG: hypothetical protein ACE1Z4_12495 [Gammaproteobacteria bacterium]
MSQRPREFSLSQEQLAGIKSAPGARIAFKKSAAWLRSQLEKAALNYYERCHWRQLPSDAELRNKAGTLEKHLASALKLLGYDQRKKQAEPTFQIFLQRQRSQAEHRFSVIRTVYDLHVLHKLSKKGKGQAVKKRSAKDMALGELILELKRIYEEGYERRAGISAEQPGPFGRFVFTIASIMNIKISLGQLRYHLKLAK